MKPNSDKNSVVGYDKEADTYRVNIKAPADKNKANKELVKFLSKTIKKRVAIASGLKSRLKFIKVVE
ncbi:MAG: YggU family protein [bacterium]|nr:YggU family protein [bacterium]